MREERNVFSLSPFLCHSLSLHLQFFLSGRKKKKKKKGSSHSDREKGRPGPGLSPLERPDWSRPAVWALLPCGRRGRQFSERCCGRRAISAVLSGQIYTAGSKLIFFHCHDTFVAALKESSVQQLILISVTGTKDLLTYCVFIDRGNVRVLFKLVKNHGLLFFCKCDASKIV